MKLLGTNILIGKNVSIGRSVHAYVTDGGKVLIGDGVTIQDSVVFYAQGGYVEVGSNSLIGVGSHIAAIDSVVIGKECLIAAYSIIRDANHGMARGLPMSMQGGVSEPVDIGDDVWLGAHVVVTAGSRIASGAVIGANAVVTSDIASYAVAVGVPARTIKFR
jgi:acetyltransferase-like isoleucine patch superfamily enzyme